MKHGWYRFEAYNSETYYGWVDFDGESADRLVRAALDSLNRDRDVNLYYVEYLGPEATDDNGKPLEDHDNPLITADTVPEDFEADSEVS